MKDKKVREKRLNMIGMGCGLFLVLLLVINIVSGIMANYVPSSAKTLTASAPGKVGDVTVEIVADAKKIYKVSVLEHNETEGIGTMAVDQIPGAIVEAQSLKVDAVSGATVTSEAILNAAAAALESGSVDPAAYGYVAPTPAPTPEPTPEPTPKPEKAETAASGDRQTAQGSGTGIDGKIVVEVTADANTIYEVNILEQNETPGIGSVAVEKLPGEIVAGNTVEVDSITGATVSSSAIKAAVSEALTSMGFDPASYQGGAAPAAEAPAEEAAPAKEAAPAPLAAKKVETKSGVTVKHAADWAEEFPNQYNTWLQTAESDEIEDYLEIYPMLRTLYEGYGFAIDYGSARGHYYDVQDIEATGRPHPLANCWTCKTPDFTNMVNEEGIEAYKKDWTEVQKEITEGISCYSCHANTPGEITITHTYWIDAVGDDFDSIAPANLACGQCHNEYYFHPETKATTIAHNSLASMDPPTMLAFFNDGSNFPSGEPFADWTNPRTGVKQIKVQHPEFETFLGAGSPHANTFTCADCHMPTMTAEDGTKYHSHNLVSPLDCPDLLENTCSKCHADLISEVKGVQEKVEARTYAVGYKLEYLTELLANAVATGKYTDEQLAEIRQLARDAQFYWDFVFVENAEGAHNPALTYDCLDKANELGDSAINQLLALTR